MKLMSNSGALVTRDLIILQGATNKWAFRFLRKNEFDVGVPVDLTGWEAHAQFRDGVGNLWRDFTHTNGIILTAGGDISVNLSASETEQTVWLVRKSGVWDMKLIDVVNENTIRFASGTVVFSPGVTRA